VSLTGVVVPKEAVVAVASEYPAQALSAAARDGLLVYHGYVTGDRYEVEVLGRRQDLPAAEVLPLVHRIRAVDALFAAGVDIHVVEISDGVGYVLELDGRRFVVPAGDVIDWCKGFRAGMDGSTADGHVGEDHLAEIEELILRPSLNDQLRLVILGLMYGRSRPEQRVTFDRLLEMIAALPGVESPPARKTLVDALAFGSPLASDLAEKMIAAFGLRWSLTGGRMVERLDGRKLRGPLPQMPGIAAFRRIVEASQAGWLRYVGNGRPNVARRQPSYPLAVGATVHVVHREELNAWLDGLAAFHRA
jgi:hypothetical protein